MSFSFTRPSLVLALSRLMGWLLVPVYLAGMSVNFWLESRLTLPTYEDITLFLGFGAFAVVGALLVSRRPANAVGWIMVAVALIVAIFPAAEGYAAYIMNTRGRPNFLAIFGAWANEVYWVPLIILVMVFMPLLFPTGKLPSPRWRPIAWFIVANTVILIGMAAVRETLVGQDSPYQIPNPIGWPGFLSLEENPLANVLLGGVAIGQVAAVAALIVRFRHSSAVERQQLKWFFYPVALSPLLFLELPVLSDLLFPVVLIGIPTAIGVAILRYRLYDIDIIIRKTLQYTLLSGLLALVYFGSVILLQNVFGVTLADSPSLIVLSTLALAGLFQPLRQRVQTIIDRRFYRQKVDRQVVLERFAQTARDEVEIGRLAASLVSAVEETIRPTGVSFWLKEGSFGNE